MGASLGDIIRITDNQTLFGQTVLNVYFYRVTSVTPLSDPYMQEFLDWFKANIVDTVVGIQHEDLVHESLLLENLTNGIDILTSTDDLPEPGAYTTAECMPPFVSWGFQLVRESRVTRNGYKRFAGVPEAGVSDGVMVGFATEIAAVEAILAADITSGIATVAEPIILKRPFVVPIVAPEYASIGSAIYKSVGSQNTRKLGRGA